jgi:hypothetical protein
MMRAVVVESHMVLEAHAPQCVIEDVCEEEAVGGWLHGLEL